MSRANGEPANGTPRRAGVSAYGFGGTNFHLVLEEHVPGAADASERKQSSAERRSTSRRGDDHRLQRAQPPRRHGRSTICRPKPRRCAASWRWAPRRRAALQGRAGRSVPQRVESGWTPPIAPPEPDDLRARRAPGDRLWRSRRAARPTAEGAQGRWASTTRRPGRRCRRRASSAAAAPRRARSPSSSPARAAST